jgi:hypothetical protein
MKLQKTTWLLLLVAGLLGGFVYFYEFSNKPEREEVKKEEKKIFAFAPEEIKVLTVENKPDIFSFERTNNKDNPWRMQEPEAGPANAAVVDFLVNLLVSGERDRTFTVPAEEGQEYGLNKPSKTIKIELKNQQKHEIILGKSDFKDEFVYAQIDPASQSGKELKISLVSQDFLFAVERNLEEWKPPEAAVESETN